MHKLQLRESRFKWMRDGHTFKLTGEHAAWCAQALGYVPFLGIINGVPQYAIFETQADLISFSLTWCAHEHEIHTFEVGGFYCPYVPVTSSGVIIT